MHWDGGSIEDFWTIRSPNIGSEKNNLLTSLRDKGLSSGKTSSSDSLAILLLA
jgi:hypothetical protein